MRPSRRLALALAALPFLAGCELLSRLSNSTIMSAVIVESPKPPLGPGSAVVVAEVFLGEKQGDITAPPSAQSVTPVTGATVRLTWDGNPGGVALVESGQGTYALDSLGNPALAYQAGQTYRFTATVGSDSFWAEVKQVPQAAQIAEFAGQPNKTIVTTYGLIPDPFPVTRSGTDIAFYAVYPVPLDGSISPSASPTCTNFPSDAGAIFALVFDDADWRVASFPLDKASCFPTPGSYPSSYVVGLTTVKKGSTSSNLSVFSAALAGTSDAGGVLVTGP